MAATEGHDLDSVPEIIIPGSFVVFQGIPGDGIANTIDTYPDLESIQSSISSSSSSSSSNETDDFEELEEEDDGEEDDEGYHHLVNENEVLVYEEEKASSSPATTDYFYNTFYSNNPTALLPSLTNLSMQPLQRTTSGQTIKRNNNNSTINDAFMVIEEKSKEQRQRNTDSADDEKLIENWNFKRHKQHQKDRKEWLETQILNKYRNPKAKNAALKTAEGDQRWWVNSKDGQLNIFRDIPKRNKYTGSVDCQIIGTLSPGATVVGTKIFCLNTKTLDEIGMRVKIVKQTATDFCYPGGRLGWLQILRIESPMEGMAVLSVDGYPYLGPGLPYHYVKPKTWFWRVTNGDGALIRDGLLLTNRALATIRHGSIIQATRKMVGNEGLSRLHVHATENNHTKEGREGVRGWISEKLNPASGQEGYIVRPLPFPVPALYRVVLEEGAKIRCSVELNSAQIGHAPAGTILSAVGRAFAEHPNDKCAERLRLAGTEDGLVYEFARTPHTIDLS